MSLRKAAIKLAFDNLDLRDQLLPLLRESSEDEKEAKFEKGKKVDVGKWLTDNGHADAAAKWKEWDGTLGKKADKGKEAKFSKGQKVDVGKWLKDNGHAEAAKKWEEWDGTLGKKAKSYPTPQDLAKDADKAAKAIFDMRGKALSRLRDQLQAAVEDSTGTGVSFKGDVATKFSKRMKEIKDRLGKADSAIMDVAGSLEALARDLKKVKKAFTEDSVLHAAIKLAHANEEVREHLLPLIQEEMGQSLRTQPDYGSKKKVAAKRSPETPLQKAIWAAWVLFDGPRGSKDYLRAVGDAAGSVVISDEALDDPKLYDLGNKVDKATTAMEKQSRSWRSAYNLSLEGKVELDGPRVGRDLDKTLAKMRLVHKILVKLGTQKIDDPHFKREIKDAITQSAKTQEGFEKAVAQAKKPVAPQARLAAQSPSQWQDGDDKWYMQKASGPSGPFWFWPQKKQKNGNLAGLAVNEAYDRKAKKSSLTKMDFRVYEEVPASKVPAKIKQMVEVRK